jgi:hypothetical protein
MKPNISVFVAAAAFVLNLTVALARDVTLTVGGAGITEVSIETNETAIVASWFPLGSTSTRLDIVKDGLTVTLYSTFGFSTMGNLPPRIAGPATIRLAGDGAFSTPRGFCTVQIEPATFPPDKTVVIPAGVGGANILLERSTDLIHWTSATPGVYTNQESHLFFRIRAERLP